MGFMGVVAAAIVGGSQDGGKTTARELAALQEYLVEPGGGSVMVWRNDRAMNEAMSLMQQGVQNTHPEMFDPLIACVVPSGAPVADLSGVFSVDVMVTGGPARGCRGTVDAAFLKHHP